MFGPLEHPILDDHGVVLVHVEEGKAEENGEVFVGLRDHGGELVGQVFVDVLAELAFAGVFHQPEVLDIDPAFRFYQVIYWHLAA